MITKTMFDKLAEALDLDNTKKKKAALKKALKKLKGKKQDYVTRLAATDNEEDRDELINKLKVVKVQRKKGLNALRELSEKD